MSGYAATFWKCDALAQRDSVLGWSLHTLASVVPAWLPWSMDDDAGHPENR